MVIEPVFESEYRGWKLFRWTGWKSHKGELTGTPVGCHICGKEIVAGEIMYRNQSFEDAHWICKFPDNRPAELHAQWLFSKDGKRFLQAGCGSMVVSELPAAEYKVGAMFDIVPENYALTELDSDAKKDEAKRLGYERMKMLIDEIEGKTP